MADNNRFYEMSLHGDRPIWWGDLGSRFNLSGQVLMGGDASAIVLFPAIGEFPEPKVIRPTAAEWWEIIRAGDDPAAFELDATNGIKIIHRRSRYVISGTVQQKVWARDGFKCLYCGAMMGKVQLTVDHFMPWEHNGPEDPTNYSSACRSCNKRKGSRHPLDWCRLRGIDPETIYAAMRKPLP